MSYRSNRKQVTKQKKNQSKQNRNNQNEWSYRFAHSLQIWFLFFFVLRLIILKRVHILHTSKGTARQIAQMAFFVKLHRIITMSSTLIKRNMLIAMQRCIVLYMYQNSNVLQTHHTLQYKIIDVQPPQTPSSVFHSQAFDVAIDKFLEEYCRRRCFALTILLQRQAFMACVLVYYYYYSTVCARVCVCE